LLLGIVSLKQYCDCIEIIVQGDIPSLIHFIEDIITAGVDIARFVTGFADVVYAMRLCGVADVSALLGYSDEELSLLKNTAQHFHDEQLSLFYTMLLDCQKELKYTGNERAVVEMFCIDIMHMLKRPTLASILKQLDESPQAVQKKNLNDITTKESKTQDDTKIIMHAWTQLLQSFRESKQYMFFKLTHVKASYSEGQLVLSVVGDSSNGYYKQLLSKQEIKQIEDELFKLSKRRVVIRIESAKNDVPPPDAVMLPHAEDPEKPHPLVEQIKTIFDGEIIK